MQETPVLRLKLSWSLILLTVWILSGCATLPTGFESPVSHALTDTGNSTLGKYVGEQQAQHPDQSGFHLLPDGLDAFVGRAVLAQLAECSIDTQYYLYHQDLIGRLFSYFLVKAADRGVRVRLLVDDMDTEGRDDGIMAMDSHPNIEIRIFNPFSRNVGRTSQYVTRMGSVTRRMHSKSFTVDNQFTILGGRNIGSEYFSADPELSFADLDVMGIGPVADRVSSVFDLYWNSELAYPISSLYKGRPLTREKIEEWWNDLEQFVTGQESYEYIQALHNSNLMKQIKDHQLEFKWGDAKVVYDRPEKLVHGFDETEYHLSPMLRPYWEGVKKELIIFSPYFVPGKEGTAFLIRLAEKGVRVRILTNSLASNDVGLVHAGYKKYRKKLLRAGVELYELDKELTLDQRKEKKSPGGSSKASLHAKSFVFDREQVFVGSLNLDPRALKHNTEIGVIFDVPEIAEEMAEAFDNNIEEYAFRLELRKSENGSETLLWHGMKDGKPTVYTHEPYAGFWRRFGIEIMSWFPIESQL
jgi:putative cardiolipin synthase